jgi:peptide/nickel transport system permease protein
VSAGAAETEIRWQERVEMWRRSFAARWEELRFVWLRFRQSPLGMVGLGIVLSFLVVAILAPVLAPPNPIDPYLIPKTFVTDPEPPSSEFLFGTGPFGTDIYYGVIWGTHVSLRISFTLVAIAFTVGLLVGGTAGYLGGWVDQVLSRLTDLFLSLPGLVLAMAVAAVLGRTIENLILALAIVWWPGYARLVRGEVLKVKEEAFVEAARAVGVKERRIVFRHVLPNALPSLAVVASMDLGTVVLVASALSFIGLGAQPGTAEWGLMISDGRNWMLDGRWWTVFFPGMAIFLFVLGWNLLGDTLRDILDPTLRRRIARRP